MVWKSATSATTLNINDLIRNKSATNPQQGRNNWERSLGLVSFHNCLHLTVEIVREIHREAIVRFRGSHGRREIALLESAVAAPQASFGRKSPYADVAEVAAAYLYYLCKNHPFVDGNERTVLGACIVFLRLNGIEPKTDGPEWEELTLAVAASAIDRDETTARLRRLLPKSD
jgi:death-on-curing protein